MTKKILKNIQVNNMKKIRIELQQNAPNKRYTLFDSADALYVWLKDDVVSLDPINASVVEISKDEFIEAEWLGCEFVDEKDLNGSLCLNYMRIAKASKTQNSGGLRVIISSGWTTSQAFPWRNHGDDVIVTKLFADKLDDHRLDFPKLFNDVIATTLATKSE
jgi:hypothetical protein